MGENSVQKNIHAALFCLFAELFKVLVGTEKRIHLHVICCIIAVVLVGFKYRVEVNTGNTELFKVIKL